MPRIIELNLTRNQAADFIDWLANDCCLGHTFSAEDYADCDQFLINGHRLSTYSNQCNHVIIDDVYVSADRYGIYIVDGIEYRPIEYCLMKLGFSAERYKGLEVEYKNGEHDFYERIMLPHLMGDNWVRHIVDLQTGELLK